ncbi:ATP-binding protein [Streptomyces sp. NPDC059892]|uniref:ATP-binding protein n=1 Tax=unclassified Streptomyces TaxID=2593676 RepID=UPI001C2BA3FC|nr:ATP-binding protein [Streptomyces sp. GMY02]QXE35521.1 ATP-binding protein [Streptomyces sp. GMY02]
MASRDQSNEEIAELSRPFLREVSTMPTHALYEWSYGFKVSAAIEAVPPARRRVRAIVQSLDLPVNEDTLAAIELMAGEVIANAVIHTGAACAVYVRGIGERLRVAVTDPDQSVAHPQAVGPDDEGGRGLVLVAALSDVWGTTPEPVGKTTWFEVSVASGAEAARAASSHQAA